MVVPHDTPPVLRLQVPVSVEPELEHVPAEQAKSVWLLERVPDSSQVSEYPPQLPQAP